MAKKQYISLSNLRDFLDNLRNKFAEKVHKHTVSDIEDYVVDSELSSTSTNPVQNKVINEELDAVSYAMNALETFINQKADEDHNHDESYDPKGAADQALTSAKSYTDNQIAAIPSVDSYTKSEMDAALAGKSDKAHNHNDVYYTEDEIDAAMAKKAESTHSHNDVYYTEAEVDAELAKKANKEHSHSNYVPTSRTVNGRTLSENVTLSASDVGADASGTAASAVSNHNISGTAHSDIRDLISGHTGDSNIHVTTANKTNWNAAYNHSTVAHAPSNAQPNQNAFSKVVANGTTVAADNTEDTLTIAAGTGIAVTGDATNDKVTITNSGVRSIATGTANGTINVNTNGTTANVAVKGLGSAAYTASTDYAPADHGHTLSKITDVTATAAEVNILDGATVSTTELNYLKGVTSNVQSQLDSKATGDHNHDDKYADKSHGNHVPATQTASNKVFLRNDNTWATVTPANIGAAAASHDHNNDYYGKTAGETLATTLAEVKEDVDAFFKDATISADAKDTLKEIQEYIATDASAAAAMTASINNKAEKDHTHTNYASTVTTTGSGNAITAITQSGNTITATKGATFLTAHPTITMQTASTSAASPAHGKTFTAIDNITKDSNGHVTQINTKTVTLPSETNLSTATATTASSTLSHSGTFKAITGLNVDGHKITPVTTTFTLPADKDTTYSTASSTTLGLVKVGYPESGKNYPVELNDNGQMYVNVPWTDTDTNTHYASKNVVGSSTATNNTTAALTNGNVYLNSVENGAVTSSHKISGSGAATVTTDASGNIIVSATDTNTTYTAGTGLSLSGTTFNHASTLTAATAAGSSGNASHGGSIKIPSITYNNTGHITSATTTSVTLPSETNLSTATATTTASTLSHSSTFKAITGLSVNGHQITPQTTTFTLPADKDTTYDIASSTTAGLVKVGYTASGKNYPVQLSDGKMYVNVPWTDNNTTYSAAGSSLGLVKTGGDVTISNGEITVNDDSHNHIVDNVDGLSDTLTSLQGQINDKAKADHTHTVSHTPAGTVNSKSITPAGTIKNTFTGTAATHSHGFTGTAASHNHTFNGTSATIKSGYTPAGSVSSTFSGTAQNSTTASATTTVYSITGVGSTPSLTASLANKCLTLSFSAGSTPTRSSVTVPTSGHTHSVTAAGTISNKFTGTASTISATYTPAGTIAETSLTPAGTIASTSITPAGSVASTFSGTAASHDHSFTGTASTVTTSTEK